MVGADLEKTLGFQKPYLLLSLALTVILSCAGCYEPSTTRSSFTSAAIDKDGRRCVFTYHKLVYKRPAGIFAYPDGGMPKYLKDYSKIGIVDVVTGKTTILVDQKNQKWLPGQGGYTVIDVNENFALVKQQGSLNDHTFQSNWFMLNLTDGSLQPTNFLQTFDGQPKRIKKYHLAPNKVWILETRPIPERNVFNEVWALFDDGRLEFLLSQGGFVGQVDDVLWFYEQDPPRQLHIDLTNLHKTYVDRKSFMKATYHDQKGKGRTCKTHRDKIIFGKGSSSDWTYQDIEIPVKYLR